MRICVVLWLGGCSGALPGPGLVPVDVDGDGWASVDGDCNEQDPDVSPGALDWPDDDVDQDCDGEDADTLPAAALEPGDLVVTEVMADPVGVDDAFGEWFEIRNDRDEAVDLEGLAVRDAGTDDFFVGSRLVIDAGGVLVFGASDDARLSGGVEVDHVYGDGSALDDEDRIRLEVDGRTIDAVDWDPRHPHDAGVALSLDPGADATANDDVGAWCRAEPIYGIGGRGTPGQPNPPCPAPFVGLRVPELPVGGLVITEIFDAPTAVDGDAGEWIELYVATGDDVDLQGLELRNDAGDRFEVLDPLVGLSGGYVVLGSFVDPAINGETPIDAEWRWGFSLGDTGDTIRLFAGTREIDSVAYDAGLVFPDPVGASLQLDPAALDAAANDDGSRWCAGIAPYGAGDRGSPGETNPTCP